MEKELNDLTSFIKKEAVTLNLTPDNLSQIGINIIADIRFTFPGHTSQLELIRRVTRKVAAYMPAFSEEDLDDIGLAIDEACTNVITHSYKKEQGVIKVEFKLFPDKLSIIIIDEGEKGQRFNLDELSPVDKEKYLETLSRGGLGVHLIKKIMDEVKYTVVPEQKNCLTMVKYIPQV